MKVLHILLDQKSMQTRQIKVFSFYISILVDTGTDTDWKLSQNLLFRSVLVFLCMCCSDCRHHTDTNFYGFNLFCNTGTDIDLNSVIISSASINQMTLCVSWLWLKECCFDLGVVDLGLFLFPEPTEKLGKCKAMRRSNFNSTRALQRYHTHSCGEGQEQQLLQGQVAHLGVSCVLSIPETIVIHKIVSGESCCRRIAQQLGIIEEMRETTVVVAVAAARRGWT